MLSVQVRRPPEQTRFRTRYQTVRAMLSFTELVRCAPDIISVKLRKHQGRRKGRAHGGPRNLPVSGPPAMPLNHPASIIEVTITKD